jgi:alanyl-tRNA synthetase
MNIPLEEHRNMPIEEAKALGAMALFGEKYGDEVRVVKYGSSIELCGGTHIPSTGMIGSLRVIGESSIAAGVRRIEAVTAEGADQVFYTQQDLIRELRALMNNMPNLAQAMKKSIEENADMKKQIEDYIREKAMRLKGEIVEKATVVNGIKLMQFIGKGNPEAMKNVAFQIKAETADSFAFVAAITDDAKCTLMVMLSDDLVKDGLHAGKIVKDAAKHIQGGGGGQPHFATAGGKNLDGMTIAVGTMKELIGVM